MTEVLTPGTVFDSRYLLEKLLDESEDVSTWRATDRSLSRRVIVHVLAPSDPRFPAIMAAVRSTATINDPRFLRILDAMEAEGQQLWSYVVCENAPGESLSSLVAAEPLTNAQAQSVILEVLDALAPVHGAGVFHRQLNPTNVMLTSNGNVKISGLALDEALRPRAPGRSKRAQEAADLRDCGKIAYAAVTGYWPVSPQSRQDPAWGLDPAPIDETDEQFWVEPRKLNHEVSPEFSRFIMSLLRTGTPLKGPRYAMADEARIALEDISTEPSSIELLDSLLGGEDTEPVDASPETSDAPSEPRIQSKPLIAIVAIAAVVAAAIMGLRSCGSEEEPTPEPTVATSTATPEPEEAPEASIVGVFDFDPPADGGDDDENSSSAYMAADGDISTVWRTLTYRGRPEFGGLKPGSGLIFDLGSPTRVHNVAVLAENQPNGVRLMVPTEADPSAPRPPMETVDQWTTIAENPNAGQEFTLEPDEAVTTRWVMVYFTTLPPIADGQYRTGIAETYINR